MIQIKVINHQNKIKEIIIKGHALYDDYGKDIVCASVSSILITTVNAIFSFSKDTIKIKEDNPFYLEVVKEDKITNTLLENMISLFYELEKNYKKKCKNERGG